MEAENARDAVPSSSTSSAQRLPQPAWVLFTSTEQQRAGASAASTVNTHVQVFLDHTFRAVCANVAYNCDRTDALLPYSEHINHRHYYLK